MDLQKCLLEGKSVIIEGNDLDINLYIENDIDDQRLHLKFLDSKMGK